MIRHGVRPDGHSMVVMPSEVFVVLTDEDLGRIIAFLKSLAGGRGAGPECLAGPARRVGLATGKFKLVAQLIADTVPPPEATSERSDSRTLPCPDDLRPVSRDDLRGDSNPDFTSPICR